MPPAAITIVPRDSSLTLKTAAEIKRGESRTAIVAVDETQGGMDAFLYAAQHYKQPGDKLILIHVALPLDPYNASHFQDEMVMKDDRRFMGPFLEKAKAVHADVEGRILVGEPRTELVEFANAVKPDVFVVGSNNHTLLTRMILGSVSDYLAHNCACPVLIVKPNYVSKHA